MQVGLSLPDARSRSAPTLSGGEAQRIRLAAQLGSNLRGVCYILDEPTIGLHHRDNQHPAGRAVEQLEAKGNTLVVVEHDEETIRRAAPRHRPGAGRRQAGRRGSIGAGHRGGPGAPARIRITGRNSLRKPLRHPLQPRRPVTSTHVRPACIEIKRRQRCTT